MKITYVYEILHSNKKNQDFYVVRLAVKENDDIIRKSEPLIWLTKEQFDKLTSTK